MAVRIEVVQGTDAGWSYVIQAREVRIGRGGGSHIRMRDPSWPDGNLHLINRQGGWLVVNRMPTGIFLDAQVLEHGQQATWYEGGLLQPTANTLLRLVSHDDAVTGTQPVVILPPGTARKASQVWQYLFIAGCVAISVFLIMQPDRGPVAQRVATGRSTAFEAQSADPVLGPTVGHVRRLLDDASLYVKQNKPGEAFRCFDQARELLDRMVREDAPSRLKGDDLRAFQAELGKVSVMVGNQLVLLHRRLPGK